jgi:hypothetical protein
MKGVGQEITRRAYVAALAVGVVDEDVEHRHPAELVGVLVDEGDLAVLGVEAVEHVAPVGRDLTGGDESDGRVLRVRIPPDLHHAFAVRAVAQDRRRDDVPAGRLGDQERRTLAVGQRAVGEVPQRSLAPDGLVDGLHTVDLGQERRVGGGHDPALRHELALRERVQLVCRHDLRVRGA